jgi:hypothetical protein
VGERAHQELRPGKCMPERGFQFAHRCFHP